MRYVICIRKPTHNAHLTLRKKYDVRGYEGRDYRTDLPLYVIVVNDVGILTRYKYANFGIAAGDPKVWPPVVQRPKYNVFRNTRVLCLST